MDWHGRINDKEFYTRQHLDLIQDLSLLDVIAK